MEEKPIIKLKLTTIDKIFELVGGLSIVAVWVLTLTNCEDLPEIIPIHFNGFGQADGFGGKGTILILPLIATILFVRMTVLNQFPHVFNLPSNITKENASQHYTIATRLLRYLKTVFVLIFGFIAFKTIQNANGDADGLEFWFLPVTLGFIFLPLIIFVIKSFKLNNQ